MYIYIYINWQASWGNATGKVCINMEASISLSNRSADPSKSPMTMEQTQKKFRYEKCQKQDSSGCYQGLPVSIGKNEDSVYVCVESWGGGKFPQT